MKGEYVDHTHHSTHMFSKLHQTNKFHHHNNHHLITPDTHHHLQLTPQCDLEADSRSPTTQKKDLTNDGATIEVGRRPRGRPPGSKNKPKPPVLISTDSSPSMSPYVIEISAGADIVDSITRFCSKRNTGLCILTGSGTVSNVTLRQPSTTPGATVTFHGRFDILSISATILTSVDQPFSNGFAISLAGPQGQIVGGNVVGPLLAAGTVYIIASSFNNPTFDRLPLEEDARNSGSVATEARSPSAVSGGGDSGHPPAQAESCGMSIYSSHLPSDVIWAPTPRQAPPPPY